MLLEMNMKMITMFVCGGLGFFIAASHTRGYSTGSLRVLDVLPSPRQVE